MAYEDRLRSVGCVRISYDSIDQWIPLSQKWKLLGKRATASSKAFVFQAADCYSRPHRLANVYAAIQGGADWVDSETFAVYGVRSGKLIVKHLGTSATGGDMSTRTSYVKSLPDTDRPSKVDSWLFKCCNKKAVQDGKNPKLVYTNTDSGYTIYLWGFNDITSLACHFGSEGLVFPWGTTSTVIGDSVPRKVLRRLRSVKRLAGTLTYRPWTRKTHD